MSTCEHVDLHGRRDCAEPAQRTSYGGVYCAPHAASNDETEAYLADWRDYLAQQDPAGECQYDTGHPGGLCGAPTGGGTYCRAHSRTSGIGSEWAIRDHGQPLAEARLEPPW